MQARDPHIGPPAGQHSSTSPLERDPLGTASPPDARCLTPGACGHGNPPDLDRYDAVLFDWDGTLVNSHPLNFRALSRACASWGLTLNESFYTSRIGTSGAELISELAAATGTHVPIDDVVAQCLDLILDEIAELQTYRPVVQLAETLHGHLPLAIASGGARRAVHAGLDATGLRPLFTDVITGEDAPRGKPDPGLFLLTSARLAVAPARCLVYEDSIEGVQAAKAAGMDVVDVRCFRT
ncbi:HAD family hydrolase [Streptomyces sp. NBC_00582]|uniref:HAD family hydrolase n=1 Tax=Streptomyces sp. NBC_00582 TaxID=2975783 RepID=UPI002E807F5F|nr:HAD family phosphatase [Streptomyces sp. NBC_00582]WUB60813.1 HAD family phosphatase [Streptomyces sp. NBC_00582]